MPLTRGRPGGPRTVDGWLAVAAWVGVLAVLACSLGVTVARGDVFAATDQLWEQAPYRDARPPGHEVRSPLAGDTVDANMPQVVQARDRLAAGDLPLWNASVAGGTPLMAVPGYVSVTPFGLPLLLVPAPSAAAAATVVQVLLAAAGCCLLGRRLGLGRGPSSLVGLAYVYSGFMVVWTGWQHTRVAAAFPFLLWAVERAVQRGRPRDAVPVALVVASMLADGFPAVALLGLLLAGVWALTSSLARRRGLSGLLVPGAGVVAGVGLVAWLLLPFLAYYDDTVDAGSRVQSSDWHLPARSLATAVSPFVLGTLGRGGWAGGEPNEVEALSYAGGAVLLLAVLGVVLPSRAPRYVRGLCAAAVLLVGVLVYGGGPLLALVQRLPVVDINYVGRARSVLGLLVALLAGLGLQAVLDGPAAALRRRGGVALLLAVVVGGGGTIAVLVRAPHDAASARLAATATAVALLTTLLAAVLLVLALGRARARLPALLALVGVVAVQALAFVDGYWPASPRESFYPVTSTHELLAAQAGGDRYLSVDRAMVDGTASAYGLRSVEGHTFHDPRYLQLLRAADPDAAPTVTSSVLPAVEDRGATLASPALDRAAARYAVLDPEDPPVCPVEQAAEPDRAQPWRGGSDLTAGRLVEPQRGAGLAWTDGPPPEGARVRAELLDAAGDVLVSGSRRVAADVAPGPWVVPLAGEDVRGAVTVRFRLEGTDRAVAVAADEDGPVVYGCAAPRDGLRLVGTGPALVYERLDSLPRVRWASAAVVVPSARERLDALAGGALPDGTVVLSRGEGADGAEGAGADERGPGGPGAGSSARLEERTVDPDEVVVDVEADGPGWVVVADALQQRGWSARVDGEEAALLPADHAFVAVRVEAGSHRLVLRYEPPGRRTGTVLALLSAVALAWAACRRDPAVPRMSGRGGLSRSHEPA